MEGEPEGVIRKREDVERKPPEWMKEVLSAFFAHVSYKPEIG